VPSGIWLDNDTFAQTAGQIWAQGAQQQVQAGHNWAQQAMQAAIQPAQDALSKLQSMVPSVPQATSAPAPVAPPPTAPAPAPPEAAPPPAPVTPPIPIGQTPTAEPTPGAPAGMPSAAPAATPGLPVPTPTPTPAPPTDTADTGTSWAQQQIQNLLNPSPATPQTAPTPAAAPSALPGLGTSTALPTPTPTPPAGAQPSAAAVTTDSSGQPSGAIDPTSRTSFAQTFAPYAQYISQATGIAPSLVAAMAGSESNFGQAAGNELFGIKALPGDSAASMATHEGAGGAAQNVNQDFATYATPLDAANRFIGLIKNTYPNAQGSQTAQDLAAGLKSGVGGLQYMTAGQGEYAGILGSIQNQIGDTVNSALGGAQNLVQNAVQTGQTAVNTAVQGVQSAVARTSQFGMGLSSGDAMAFCGPAAALAFAQTYGRNPTVDEAKQLAQQVGWNPDQGMAGVSSEVSLLKNMGIDAHATQGVDWSTVGQDASSGNPVIIDTPGHYYYVDGFNQQTGQLHVGTSGTDLKGGSEWMTPDQINAMPQSHGSARAAIFADHPLSGPGQASAVGQGDRSLNVGPLSIPLPAPGESPHPMPGVPGALATPPGTYHPAPSSLQASLLQTGQNLVSGLISGSSDIQNQAQTVAQAVLNVGGQAQGAGQDLLGQGQNLLSQAPQSLSDMLQQNALTSQGVPTVQGALSTLPDVSAQGIANGIGGVPAYLQQLGQQRADYRAGLQGQAQQYGVDVGDILNGPQTLGINPYQDIVQQGIPRIASGIQQGNVGDVLGGGLQTLLGAASVLPGAGGAADLAGRGALQELTSAAPEVLSAAAPEVAGGRQALLDEINAAAQSRISQDDLLRSINQSAAQRIALDDLLRNPASYDEYGVLKGFQPPGGITYSERGIQIDPTTGQEMVPPPPGPEPLPASTTLEGLQQMAKARGLDPRPLAERLQSLIDQVNASSGTPGITGGAQPGLAASQFARMLGGGAAGGYGTYEATDPNDPNRLLKIAGGAGAGALAAGPGLDVAAQIPGRFAAASGTAPGAISAGDWLKGAYKGGVISGLNTMSDVAFNSTLGPVMGGAAGYLRDVGSALTGQPAVGRVAGRTLGALSGMADWGNNFLQGISDSLARPGSLTARAGSGAPSIVANLIDGAGALHGAFQNATAGLIQSMERGAAAGGGAGNNIFNPAWHSAFSSNLASLPADVGAGAGARAAARSDLGQLTGWLGQVAGSNNVVANALFPVYKMGMNLGTRMVESSPLGLAGTALDVGKSLVGRGPYAAGLGSTPASNAVGPLGERLANNVLGTALSVWLASKAMNGEITGSGPSDPAQRAVWLANGAQPDSFQGPDGNYYPWAKLPPQLRGPMMAAGAYADAMQAYAQTAAKQPGQPGTGVGAQAYGHQDPVFAAAGQLVSEVGTQLMSATPLRTFANLYDSLSSGNIGSTGLQAATDIPSSIAGGLIPESGLVRSVAQMTDPSQRQVLNPRTPQELLQSIQQNVQQNVPGVREALPARQDILGRAVSNPLQGLGELSPLHPAAGQPTPLLNAMQTAGVAPTLPPRTIDYGRYQQVALTPAEQRAWQQAQGQILQQSAAQLVASPGFQSMPQKSQQMALQRYDQLAAHAADMQVLSALSQSGQVQGRLEPKSGGALAPVVGYGPNVAATQMLLQQQQMRNAQSQALIQSLLGQ
jgi:flagellum-specific peptidoglycan hydrolase FlgJ